MSERGAASIQASITYLFVLLLIFGMVQGVLYFHAQNTAQSVANGAVQVARVEGGTAAAGRAEAADRLARGGDAFATVNIRVTRGQERATAVVTGTAPSLIRWPGFQGLPIRQSATGPVERFTQAGVGP